MVPTRPLTRALLGLLAVGVLGAVVLVATRDGDDADPAGFCRSVRALRDSDLFEDLAVASPEDMRDAFDELRRDAVRLRDLAPPESRVQARRYAAAVDEVARELAGAGYDPRRLDPLRYRQATDAYTRAAVSLDNAAERVCVGREDR